MGLKIHSLAVDELELIIRHYDQEREGLGQEFFREYRRTVERIENLSGSGSPVAKDCRRRRMDRFPYGVVFRVHGDDIEIFAIAHLKRKPNYWQRRVKDVGENP